jgi:hypothetical protein
MFAGNVRWQMVVRKGGVSGNRSRIRRAAIRPHNPDIASCFRNSHASPDRLRAIDPPCRGLPPPTNRAARQTFPGRALEPPIPGRTTSRPRAPAADGFFRLPCLGPCTLDDPLSTFTMSTPRELLDRLDTRHDELIQKLDDLNSQIEKALAEIFKNRAATSREAAIAGATVPPADAARRAA